jgi:hypothetical protein
MGRLLGGIRRFGARELLWLRGCAIAMMVGFYSMANPEKSMAATGRIESLDQFRGYTVAGMFVVNFLGSYDAMPVASSRRSGRWACCSAACGRGFRR